MKDLIEKHSHKSPFICIARVTEHIWHDGESVHLEKRIRTAKRLSYGYDILSAEMCEDLEGLVGSIDLQNLEPGYYSVFYVGYGEDFELRAYKMTDKQVEEAVARWKAYIS